MTKPPTYDARKTLTSDEWISTFGKACAVDFVGVDRENFIGWFQPYSVFGLSAVTLGSNIERLNRTARHTRFINLEAYRIFFQVSGRSTFAYRDRFLQLDAGALVLVDPVFPMTIINETGLAHHMALLLPRRELASHLGFEPRAGLQASGTSANRLLLQLMGEALRDDGAANALSEPQMQLVVYDLLGALFAPRRGEQGSTYGDKLFARICGMIEARFADPDLTPSVVAAEARISMRYLQKLFSGRGTTCGHFIHSLRLDRASRLLQRRALSKSGQHLSEIALACGFLDYAHFSRKFRERFGHSPGAHAAAGAQTDKQDYAA
jgi:AraC family transcriptional regulator, positive regulator of tynA and feaB